MATEGLISTKRFSLSGGHGDGTPMGEVRIYPGMGPSQGIFTDEFTLILQF